MKKRKGRTKIKQKKIIIRREIIIKDERRQNTIKGGYMNTITYAQLQKRKELHKNTIVGNASYNKFGRSMALLNVFINFIQVNAK